ncbi:MAG: hypothetical protein Q4C85_07905 [Actinomyces sp.]|uniref:hypothetical protein n=1 Tax=Actinomyces sp. TaxID=29317 RepID=UPI0026DAC53A|nr:hypothetical protein [Actinomyces sp.]MDO4243667.1 hypothetical protein [Actinomyces sp.]
MMTSRRALLTGAAATAVAAALAACSNEVPATSAATTSPSAQPVLDSERLTAILERIQKGMDAADAEKSTDALKGYLVGPASRVRGEQYTIATATGDDTRVHTFTTTPKAGTVGLTAEFPRTAMAVTEVAEGDSVEYLLALTQDSARDDFQLWGWARLFAGVVVPATAAPSVGAEQVDADAAGLVATPQEVLDRYVDALNNPEGDNGKAFADDLLRQTVANARATDFSGMGEASVTATAGADGFKGLRTADGGALVMTTLRYDRVYKNTVAGSTISVDDAAGALMGDNKTVVGTVTTSYDVIIAFSIPPEGSDTNAVALGMDSVIAGVTRDDSQAPTG